VAAEWPDANQCQEVPMPFVIQRDGFIIAPYFDYLSFVFDPAWRYPARDILSLMVKVADSECGSVGRTGVSRRGTTRDNARFTDGVSLCTEVLSRYGVRTDRIFLGTPNAGHPGGTLPLTLRSAASFHDERLPANVYLADATLFPHSLGNPPILTIVAMAKRVASLCRARWSD
jgi:hypothetical protein